MALDGAEDTLDELLDGGFFPELADDPDRFAGLVPEVREYLRETIPALPEPDPPTYAHPDYRYGNLLVDARAGETRAVLDWAATASNDPAYNLATTESLLFDPVSEDGARVATPRRAFREAYADEREGWTFDRSRTDRIETYRLLKRLDAMACLPLWYEDAAPDERDRRAREHREFVDRYLRADPAGAAPDRPKRNPC